MPIVYVYSVTEYVSVSMSMSFHHCLCLFRRLLLRVHDIVFQSDFSEQILMALKSAKMMAV